MPYSSAHDPYCYAGTTVLKNRPGLRQQADLDRFEHRSTALRAEEPMPEGRLSVRHYRAIHHHLFQDVYSWAGQFRKVRMSKGNSMFCYPEYIAAQISQLFEGLGEKKRLTGLDLEVFASGGASFLAALNAIHCFRDGNGRAQLSFMTLLCHRAGHPIDFGRFNQAAFLEAMIMSFGGDERQLTRLIQDVCRRL